MKTLKLLIFNISFLFFFLGHVIAQQDIILLDKEGNDITNEELTVNGLPTAMLKAEIFFKNVSDQDHSVFVEKIEVSVLDNTINYFCWDNNCFENHVFVAPDPIILEPDAISGPDDFYGAYEADGQVGTSIIKYRFFSDRDDFDAVEVTVNYITEGANTSSELTRDFSGSLLKSVFPNPAKTQTTVSYQVSSRAINTFIRVHSITGKIIEEFNINPAATSYQIDTTGLQKGVYMIILVSDGRILASRKLIITE